MCFGKIIAQSQISKYETMETENQIEKLEKGRQYYSRSKFWAKIRRIGIKAGEQVIYNALLLYYVMRSPDVPLKHKALIAGALGYLILPADIIPDAIPMMGFTDDLSAIYFVIQTVSSSITPAIRKQAELKTKEILNQNKT